jgi:hypothetical protein
MAALPALHIERPHSVLAHVGEVHRLSRELAVQSNPTAAVIEREALCDSTASTAAASPPAAYPLPELTQPAAVSLHGLLRVYGSPRPSVTSSVTSWSKGALSIDFQPFLRGSRIANQDFPHYLAPDWKKRKPQLRDRGLVRILGAKGECGDPHVRSTSLLTFRSQISEPRRAEPGSDSRRAIITIRLPSWSRPPV